MFPFFRHSNFLPMRTLIFLSFFPVFLLAQEDYGSWHSITCFTQDTAENAFMPPQAAILSGDAELKTQFLLDFSDNVPTAAQDAIRFAANVWGTYLDSEVPIRVAVDWEDRMDTRLLASAGPSTLFRDFQGGEPNTWYPVALAEALAGVGLNDDADPDITVNANSTANWYFGTDGNTPRNQIDLASVMLHELGHGLGFLGSVDTINETQLSIGFAGRFIVYDLFLETPAGAPLVDAGLFNNPSAELLMAVTSNDLLFTGEEAINRNSGNVPIYSPSSFDGGSSVSHLDEGAYLPGTENALMTPFLSSGEAVHDPGPVTLGIFFDMGWPLVFDLTSPRSPSPVPLAVYPNPASDFLTVKLPSSGSVRWLDVHTVDGRRVLRQRVNVGLSQLEVPVGKLARGLYQVSVVDGGTIYDGRVVIR